MGGKEGEVWVEVMEGWEGRGRRWWVEKIRHGREHDGDQELLGTGKAIQGGVFRLLGLRKK